MHVPGVHRCLQAAATLSLESDTPVLALACIVRSNHNIGTLYTCPKHTTSTLLGASQTTLPGPVDVPYLSEASMISLVGAPQYHKMDACYL